MLCLRNYRMKNIFTSGYLEHNSFKLQIHNICLLDLSNRDKIEQQYAKANLPSLQSFNRCIYPIRIEIFKNIIS